MEQREDINGEIRQISPLLAGLDKVNPYSLSAGYFENLPESVLERVKTDFFAEKVNTYQVPEGYFEGFASQVLARIQENSQRSHEIAKELDEVAPLLNTISTKQVYGIPEQYFENTGFAKQVLVSKTEARVFSLRSARKWMQYAAAAVFAGVLITGAFMFTDNSENYLEYEKYKQVDIPSVLDSVSEEDLVRYLENNPEHVAVNSSATLSSNEAELFDVNSNLQNLSDEALTQYLKENGENTAGSVSGSK